MTTYTKEQLLKAVEYACMTQRAEDYLIAANNHLSLGEMLDELYKVDPKDLVKITIKEIDEHLAKSINH